MSRAVLSVHKKYEEIIDLKEISMHTHDCYELYCFLKGDVKYFVEGTIYDLKPGDLLIMKKSEAHSLLVNSNSPYERILVFFNEESIIGNDNKLLSFIDRKPLGKNNRYRAVDLKKFDYMYLLEKMCKLKDKSKISAYLTVLINELSSIKRSDGRYTDNTAEIIAYINQHITENLSLDNICEHFFISKTHLIRKFKALTGTTVWDYIVTKRLVQARLLLQKGEKPTDVFLKCGFNDYCSFFKAYKQKFGVSPKNDCKRK